MYVIDFESYYDKDVTLSKMGTREYINHPSFEVIGMGLRRDLTSDVEWYTGDQVEQVLRSLWPDDVGGPPVLAHNVMFDAGILAWHYNIRPSFYFDTLSMARATLRSYIPNGSVSLAAVADYMGFPAKGGYVNFAKGKHLKDFTPLELQDYGAYCKHDTWLCSEIFKQLAKAIPPSELLIIDTIVRMYLEPHLQLNTEALRTELQAEQLRRLDAISKSGVSVSTLRSRKQLVAEFEKRGAEVGVKTSTATGKETWALAKTDEAMIDLLGHPKPDVRALAEARLAISSNINLTRTERLLHLSELFPDWSVPLLYYGAHTGRCSGGEKINPQNLQRGSAVREAITAPFGYKVVALDLSQIEARMAAWWAHEPWLLDRFAAKDDVYAAYARQVYGDATITADTNPTARRVGKEGVLSLQFGVSKMRFAEILLQRGVQPDWEQSYNIASRTVDHYRNTFANIIEGWHRCSILLTHANHNSTSHILHAGASKLTHMWCNGVLTLPNGMAFHFPELQQGERQSFTYRQGKITRKLYGAKLFQNIVQALARIVCFEQMVTLLPTARPCLLVHDENVYVIKDELVDSFVRQATAVATTPPSWCPDLPLDCEVGVGQTYGSCK